LFGESAAVYWNPRTIGYAGEPLLFKKSFRTGSSNGASSVSGIQESGDDGHVHARARSA